MPATATRAKAQINVMPIVFQHVAAEGTVLIKPGHDQMDQWGNRTRVAPVWAQFTAHRFVVTADNYKQFDMSRDELLTRLREHGCNRDADKNGGTRVASDFWELKPHEIAPAGKDLELLQKIGLLAAGGNREGIQEVLREEEGSYRRPMVLSTAEDALRLLDART